MKEDSVNLDCKRSTEEIIKKEDRRVRRTKKLLTQGLFHLLENKPIKDITVSELAEVCDINRGTFYLYYKDVFDMLEQVENSMFEELNQLLMEQEKNIEARDSYPVLYALFSYIDQNKEICRVLLSEKGDIGFLERIDHVLREKCRNEWKKIFDETSFKDFEIGYSFVIFGCIGMLRSWINSKDPEPVELISKMADTLLHKGALTLIAPNA